MKCKLEKISLLERIVLTDYEIRIDYKISSQQSPFLINKRILKKHYRRMKNTVIYIRFLSIFFQLSPEEIPIKLLGNSTQSCY